MDFNHILHQLNSISPAAWAIILPTVLQAIITSPIMLGVKKWFSVDGEKKMLFFVMLGSMGAALVGYLITVPRFAPWFILVSGWLTFATTQPVYLYAVKPLARIIGSWFSGKIAEATAINEAKNAAVPATGLPITATGDNSVQ